MSRYLYIINFVGQNQKTVSAYFLSKHKLPFGFASRNVYIFIQQIVRV